MNDSDSPHDAEGAPGPDPVPGPQSPTAPFWAMPAAGPAAGGNPPVSPPRPGEPGEPPSPAAPTVSDGEPIRTAVPLFRRPVMIALAGVGAAVVLVGAGFVAGLSVHRQDSTSLVSAQGGSGSFQPGGHGGPGGYPDGQGGGRLRARDGAGTIVGRITAVNGSTLTLSGFGGRTVQVTTTSSTRVSGAASVSSLSRGERVIVLGTQNSDGSVAATSIIVRADGDGQSGQMGQAGAGTLPGSGSGALGTT